ncbi:MAG: Uma2 family endonuclease [Chloroflexota bacterium]
MTIELQLIDLNREYTAEEFEALPDDGNHYQLIGGKLVMTPATGDEHGRILDNLYRYLVMLDPWRKLGQVRITTGYKIGKNEKGKDNIPEPDLGFVVAHRVPPVGKGAVPVVPDLVIEVWSPSEVTSPHTLEATRAKIQMFLQAGVSLAWGINPAKQQVEVYHQGQPIIVLNTDDELSGEDIIPNFRLKVSELFDYA